MNIDPRILDGLILVITALLGALGGSLAVIPRRFDARLEIYRQEQETKNKERLQEIDDKATEARLKVEAATAEREVLKGLVANHGELVNSISIMARNIVSDLSERVEMRKTVQANTEALTSQVEAVGEFGDRLDDLLATGSKPLQEANGKLDRIIVSILEVKTGQAESATKLEVLIRQITELQSTLNVAKNVAVEKLTEIKESTGEVTAVLKPSEP